MIVMMEKILKMLKVETTQELIRDELTIISKAITKGDADDLNHAEVDKIHALFRSVQVRFKKVGYNEKYLLNTWNLFNNATLS